MFREYGLRMELHPVDRLITVTDSHDLTVSRPGGYNYIGARVIHNQRIITDN